MVRMVPGSERGRTRTVQLTFERRAALPPNLKLILSGNRCAEAYHKESRIPFRYPAHGAQ